MSTKASNWVWECLEELDQAETLVMLALADQANDAGVAWPAQGSLARRARQTDRNVRRVLVKLQRMGLLSVERRSSNRGRRSNRYQLHIGARIGNPLGSQQSDILSGCGGSVDNSPVDNLSDVPFSRAVAATGQSVRLRNGTGCPVAQPDTDVRSQPDTDVRLLPITGNHQLNHQTVPDRTEGAGTAREPGPVGSGPGMGSSSYAVGRAAGAAARRPGSAPPGRPRPAAPPSGAGAGRAAGGAARQGSPSGPVSAPAAALDAAPDGGGGSGNTPRRPSRAPGAAERASDVSGHGSGSEIASDRLSGLLGGCLPEWMRVMDAAGARAVGALLEARLAAGWRPEQIRAAMSGRRPERVGRMSALVASRLERNVDPALAPARGSAPGAASAPSAGAVGGASGAAAVRAAEDARWEARRRRSEALAAPVRRDEGAGEDPLWARALAQAARLLPGAGAVERARAAAGLVARWLADPAGAAVAG